MQRNADGLFVCVLFPSLIYNLLMWPLTQIPLDRFLLETDAPDGKPKLDGLLSLEAGHPDEKDVQLNHPGNIR